MQGYRLMVPEFSIGDLCRKANCASFYCFQDTVDSDDIGVVVGKERASNANVAIYTVWFPRTNRTVKNVLPYEISAV